MSFQIWNSFISPVIDFVLGVGDEGYIQFLPIKNSKNLPSNIQEVENVRKSLPVSNSKWLELINSNSSEDLKDVSLKDLRSTFLRFKVNDQIILKDETVNSISSINYDKEITINTKKKKI